MNKLFYIIPFLLLSISLSGQNNSDKKTPVKLIVDKNVLNAHDSNEKEIIEIWTNYLNAGEFKNPNTIYWDKSQYLYPDYFLWPMNLK